MALARIITRSQTCSRELSLVLRARGYTVEVVSPDKVPDNIADLELRVDAGPENQLLANVETHGGERTASLKFVHHLKAPMIEFTPSDPGGAVHFSNEPVTFNKGADAEPLEMPEVPQPVPRTPSLAQLATVLPMQAAQRHSRSEGWPWRAALAFAGVILLAGALGFSVRRSSNGAVQSSPALHSNGIAASTAVNQLSTVGVEKDSTNDTGQISALPWRLPTADSDRDSIHALKDVPGAKAETPTLSPRAAVSHRRGDDVVARNTIIYFDKRFEPAPKAKRPQPKKKVHPIVNTPTEQ
jgi:hypothetical protein